MFYHCDGNCLVFIIDWFFCHSIFPGLDPQLGYTSVLVLPLSLHCMPCVIGNLMIGSFLVLFVYSNYILWISFDTNTMKILLQYQQVPFQKLLYYNNSAILIVPNSMINNINLFSKMSVAYKTRFLHYIDPLCWMIVQWGDRRTILDSQQLWSILYIVSWDL